MDKNKSNRINDVKRISTSNLRSFPNPKGIGPMKPPKANFTSLLFIVPIMMSIMPKMVKSKPMCSTLTFENLYNDLKI